MSMRLQIGLLRLALRRNRIRPSLAHRGVLPPRVAPDCSDPAAADAAGPGFMLGRTGSGCDRDGDLHGSWPADCPVSRAWRRRTTGQPTQRFLPRPGLPVRHAGRACAGLASARLVRPGCVMVGHAGRADRGACPRPALPAQRTARRDLVICRTRVATAMREHVTMTSRSVPCPSFPAPHGAATIASLRQGGCHDGDVQPRRGRP